MESVQRLSRSLSGLYRCLQTSRGRQCANTWEGVWLLRHPTWTAVLSSVGWRGVNTSADQDGDSEGTRELPADMQLEKSQKNGETQTSGLQAQGSLLSQQILIVFLSHAQFFFYLYLLKHSSTFEV